MRTLPIRLLPTLLLLAASATLAMADTRIEKEWPLAGGKLTVRTSDGAITVTGSDRKTVRLVLTAETKDFAERFTTRFDATADAVSIVIERKDSARNLFGLTLGRGEKVALALEVPRATLVDLNTAGGPIDATGIMGAVRAVTSGGPIKIESVTGDVNVKTSGGGIDIADITGKLNAETSGGPIRILRVTGAIKAETSGGGISISGAGDRVDAETSGGSVSVAFTKGNAKGGVIESSGGGIEVKLDPSVDLNLDAETSAGSIHNKLEDVFNGSSEREELHGKLNQGGAVLQLSTSAGSISIQPL